jgi:uncharacterized metal-binding protein
MANGKTHHRSTLTLSGIILLLVAICFVTGFFTYIGVWIPVIHGIIYGIFFSCDLDIPSRNHSETFFGEIIGFSLSLMGVSSKVCAEWANKGAKIAEMIGHPFGIMVPHRSWASHAPILSTIIRFLYIELILCLVSHILMYTVPFSLLAPIVYTTIYHGWDMSVLYFLLLDDQNWVYWCITLCVMMLIDVQHYLFDGGLIHINGKKRYTLGKWYYGWAKRNFGSSLGR